MGTSVENNDYIHRIDTLRLIPAQTRFLSLEPLIGSIHQLDLNQIHWLDFTQNLREATDAITLGRRQPWLASEGFSLSAANAVVRELPATLYH